MQENSQRVQQKRKIVSSQTQQKPKKRIGAGLAISLFLFASMIVFFSLVYFNVAGLKQKVAGLLEISVPADNQNGNEWQTLEEERAALDQRQVALDKKDKELSDLEDELYGIEQVLNQKIDEQETALAQMQSQEDALVATALIIEQMDANNAAEAVSRLKTVDEMANFVIEDVDRKSSADYEQHEAGFSFANCISNDVMIFISFERR